MATLPDSRLPDSATPRVADWRINHAVVVRALRLIERGYLRDATLASLAQTLGVQTTELRQAFVDALGVSPSQWSKAFNRNLQNQLRASDRTADKAQPLSLKLAVREPYAADWVIDFLDKRSLPGLEEVVDGAYRRRIGAAWLSVRHEPGALHIQLPRGLRSQSAAVLGRIAHVFDVHADPLAIDTALKAEKWLAPKVTGGVRVPGAWDGFETAVRAILGQQVSVARARNLAIDLMQRFGSDGFPRPSELEDADVSAIGMPGKRGEAVRQLARAVINGDLLLDNSADPQTQFDTLCGLPGIGPWTAGYVSMRIAGNADAFPRGDWVILKQLGMTAAVAEKYSQSWSPWRAYALMYIWQASAT